MDLPPIIWGRCPYPEEICDSLATMEEVACDGETITLRLTCAAGHRWMVEKIADEELV